MVVRVRIGVRVRVRVRDLYCIVATGGIEQLEYRKVAWKLRCSLPGFTP